MWGYLVSTGERLLGKTVIRTIGRHGGVEYVERSGLKRIPQMLGQKEVWMTAPKYLQAGAIGLGALSLAGWAGSNVYQTGIIHDDTMEQLQYQKDNLQWQKDKFEAEEEARQEDYEHGLLQSGIIEAFDAKDRQFQAQLQSNQMSFETAMYNAKLNQMANDRNTYLANQAFQTFTGGRLSPKDDQFTIAFILTELMALQSMGENQNAPISMQDELDPFYEEEYTDFDNLNNEYSEY